MTVSEFLAHGTERLTRAGVATGRLDTLVMLEDTLHIDRANLLAHPDMRLSDEQVAALDSLLEKREQHVPLAYLRGHTEFYGRTFFVDNNVLEPRPESETIIELFKSLDLPAHCHVVDIGTGSGALAITAKLERPDTTVTGIDIDPACLLVAGKNAQALHADVDFVQGDLVAGLTPRSEHIILLCNLPYVPDSFQINTAALHEPRLAIFGGPDGLDPYRKLFNQLHGWATKPSYILTESMPPDHEALRSIAQYHGYMQLREDDFIQVFAPR